MYGVSRSVARLVGRMGLLTRFSIVGLTVGLIVAGVMAWFIEGQVTNVLLANLAARAADQVDHLAVTRYVTPSDFASARTSQQLDSLASRMDPIFNDMHDDGTGVIRLQLFATDGTLLYADQHDRRGERIDVGADDHLAQALSGQAANEVSELDEVENRDLKANYDEALEVYVPVEFDGQVTGAYEIYQDMRPVRAVRPLVWGVMLGGFGLLFLALYGVMRAAAVLIGRQQQSLTHRALHDTLTDLPNRALFLDRLAHALARHAPEPVSVLLVKMDGLQLIKDSLGHGAGDQLLVEVALRLRRVLAPADTLARVGDDEFCVLLEDVHNVGGAASRADQLLALLRAPLNMHERDLFPTANVGVAVGTSPALCGEELLRDAGTAMSRARARGKNTYEVFNQSMAARAVERLALESDLRRALERGELRLYYQPILNLRDGRLSEVEALARWQHPQRGLVLPAEFIPVAEETGLIVPIGQWVLEEACRQAAQWRAALGSRAPIMGVNLSAHQLQRPQLVNDVRRAVYGAQLDPRVLKLEITESVVMADAESTVETLRSLKALGVSLAIDDFGTGYSSLAYLKRFPVDTLKVDRSFVDGVGDDPQDTAIVQSVIALARAFGLSVTGEGIETEMQLVQLRELGCERGQGYFFARPCPPEELTGMLGLNRQHRLVA